MQNMELVGDTWLKTSYMSTLKYFLADAVNQKVRVHQLDLIGAFLQAKVKNGVFVKLDSKYADYFSEYSNYFERALRYLKSMYGMSDYGKLFADELTECLLEAGFNLNVNCLYITIMNYMEQKMLLYIMLMNIYISIFMKLLGNGL